jgi:hypothetical protein
MALREAHARIESGRTIGKLVLAGLVRDDQAESLNVNVLNPSNEGQTIFSLH